MYIQLFLAEPIYTELPHPRGGTGTKKKVVLAPRSGTCLAHDLVAIDCMLDVRIVV